MSGEQTNSNEKKYYDCPFDPKKFWEEKNSLVTEEFKHFVDKYLVKFENALFLLNHFPNYDFSNDSLSLETVDNFIYHELKKLTLHWSGLLNPESEEEIPSTLKVSVSKALKYLNNYQMQELIEAGYGDIISMNTAVSQLLMYSQQTKINYTLFSIDSD